MNPIVRNILAVLAGIIIGSMVNMGIITISNSIIPLPEGVNPEDMESLKENIHLFKPIDFLPIFLAHALGAFVGALVAGFVAVTHKMKFALSIGVFFLFGGIAMVMMLPTPMWFNALDLIVAYIPMGFLAGKIATKGN